jgi:hypothetical protein
VGLVDHHDRDWPNHPRAGAFRHLRGGVMTRDQVMELSRLANDVQRWLQYGNQREPPVADIRALARLASIAANEVEFLSRKQ